jgi:hypothetical protein
MTDPVGRFKLGTGLYVMTVGNKKMDFTLERDDPYSVQSKIPNIKLASKLSEIPVL